MPAEAQTQAAETADLPSEAAEIPLNNANEVALVSPQDEEEVRRKSWRMVENKAGNRYAVTGKSTYMHRFLMECEDQQDIDHINDNGLDNRRENLRVCTRSENIANKRTGGGKYSQYRGVTRSPSDNKPWMAQITVDGVNIYLGIYETEKEAALAYDKAALDHFGDYARTNIIEE